MHAQPVTTAAANAALRGSRADALSSPAQENHIFTSGATGTNAAVIRGAARTQRGAPVRLALGTLTLFLSWFASQARFARSGQTC